MKAEKQDISKYEIYFCNSVYFSSVIYGLYHVFMLSLSYKKDLDDFEEGWFFGYKKDVTLREWETAIELIKFLMPWLLIHLIMAEYIRWAFSKALPVFHIFMANLLLITIYGKYVALCVFLTILLHLILLTARSWWLIQIFNTSIVIFFNEYCLMVVNYCHQRDEFFFNSNVHLRISLAWLQMKCASFSFDLLAKPFYSLDLKTILSALGYSYYIPTFFLGPFSTYRDYEKELKKPSKEWTNKSLFVFVSELLYYIGWGIILDLFLHFFHIYALEYYIEDIKELGLWFVNGIVYSQYIFFVCRYIFYYGLSGTFARAEGYTKMSPGPKMFNDYYCSLQVWRDFDVGFHRFMRTYIYLPIINNSTSKLKKQFATTLAFTYVYLWHGQITEVLYWSVLNYFQCTAETWLLRLAKVKKIQNFFTNNFSSANIKRLTALFYSPLYILLVVFNSLFFSAYGTITGKIAILQFFVGNWTLIITALFISYCYSLRIVVKNEDVNEDKAEEKQP